jgi:hypothetical protein
MRPWIAIALLLAGCASQPPADPNAAAVWGYVRLAPKSGAAQGGDSYADRRVRNVARFDYAHPKFAVVYAPGTRGQSAGTAALALVDDGRGGARWEPALAALALGERLLLVNRSAQPQVVSAPLATFVGELAPGETVALSPPTGGELEIHALGAPARVALVWVAPGAFAVADAAGRYELRGLPPGPVDIRAWHPRLPPSGAHPLEARAGEVMRLDLEIGVDQMEGGVP